MRHRLVLPPSGRDVHPPDVALPRRDEVAAIGSGSPMLFQGLERSRRLELVSTTRFKSAVQAMHLRRKDA
jgi:hypothetical protein